MLIISLIRLVEWIKVFNDTFYIVYLTLIYNLDGFPTTSAISAYHH
jgi:hypothetical protein